MSLHPYLFFTKTARAAMTQYQEIFGGQLDIMSFGELPEGERPPFEVDDDQVMHAALAFGDGDLIMASDDPTGDGAGVKGVAISISTADQAEARRIFAALADGGSVDMPDVSPIHADLAGLPPALFSCGTRDLLLDDTLLMALRWKAARSTCEVAIHPGGCHVFQAFDTKQARESLAGIHDFLIRTTGRPGS